MRYVNASDRAMAADRVRREKEQARKKLEKAAPALLEACEKANKEIIAAIEIPTDKRLEKDKDNPIYVIRDMLVRINRGQQILKAAIAAVKKER